MLILSILGLTLATTVVLWKIYEARGDVMVTMAEDEAAMPKERRKLKAASESGGLTSPLLGSSSVSGCLWLLDRPPVATIVVYCTFQRRRTRQHLLTLQDHQTGQHFRTLLCCWPSWDLNRIHEYTGRRPRTIDLRVITNHRGLTSCLT